MRKQYMRDLLKKIDLDGDAIFQHYIAVRTVPGTVTEGDKYLVLGYRSFNDGEYLDGIDYFEQADEIYFENDEMIGRVVASVMCALSAGRVGDLDKAAECAEIARVCSSRLGNTFLKANALMVEAANLHFAGMHGEGSAVIAQLTSFAGGPVNLLKVYANYYSALSFIYEREQNYDLALKFAELAYQSYLNHYEGVESVNSMNAQMVKASFLAKKGETIEALRILAEVEKLADGFGMHQSIMKSKKFQAEIYHQIGENEMAFIKHEEYFNLYAERMDDRLRNPEDEYESLKLAVEISQDELMVKNGELLEKNRLLEELAASQTIVRKIGYALTSVRKVDEVFENFAKGISEIVDFDWLTIGIVEGDYIVVKFDRSKTEISPLINHKIPIESEDYMFSYAIRNGVDLKFGHVREIRDYVTDDYYAALMRAEDGTFGQSTMLVRLMYDGRTTGIIGIRNFEPYKYSSLLFSTMKALSSFLSIAINNAVQNETLDGNARKLEGIILIDELTGLENRRAYDIYVNKLTSADSEYAIIYLDMNHLKKINDSLGHFYGDRYLRAIATVMNSLDKKFRKFRLSGDEFVVITEEANMDVACDAAEQIKRQCEKIRIKEYPVSVAAGCSLRMRGISPKAALVKAEERMYMDKSKYYQDIGQDIG